MSLLRQSLRLLRDNRVSSIIMISSGGFIHPRCYNPSPLSCLPCSFTSIGTFSTKSNPDSTIQRMYPTGRAVVYHLKRLSDSIKRDESIRLSILEDATFKDIIQDLVINLENTSLFYNYSINDLCSIYRSLLEIGFDKTHEVIDLLERMICEGLDGATIGDFRLLIAIHHLIYQTTNGKKLFSEISYRMEHIISGMNLGQLIGLLSSTVESMPVNFLEKVEQTSTTAISQITDHQSFVGIYLKFFVRLANYGRRPLPLLHVLKNGLKGCDLTNYPEPLHLINVVAALNKLNYPDLLLLQRIESYLINNDNLKNVKINGLSALLTAAGKMNWRCDAILNQMSKFIQDETLPLRQQEMVSFVLAAAKLNYNPDFLPNLLTSKVLPDINLQSLGDSIIYLDFVWSLVIMELVPVSMIESIFSESFLKSLEDNKNLEAKFSKWKLLNILTFARSNNMKVNDGLDLKYFQCPPRSVESCNQGVFITEILTSFIARKKDLIANFESPVGCIIDAEFIMNKELKVLPISEYGTHVEPLKEIPNDYKRISLIGYGFKDLIINDSSLIGPRRFVVDALNKLGTNVVTIRSNELNQQMKPVDRVKILRTKIIEVFS